MTRGTSQFARSLRPRGSVMATFYRGARGERGAFTVLELLVVLGVLSVLVGLIAPAVQRARENARRTACLHQLRQMGHACEAHLATQRRYPTYLNIGRPGASASGHVRLLPYLEQRAVYDQVPLELVGDAVAEPPTCPADLTQIPLPMFHCPSDEVRASGNSYRACFGTTPGIHATWRPGLPRPPEGTAVSLWGVFLGARTAGDVSDGLSHTVLFSERVVGDGDASRYTPWRDIARTPRGIYYPDDAVAACAEIDHPAAHISYGGWTWLLTDYSQTAYNHVLPPNSAVPDCVDGWNTAVVHEGAVTARSRHDGGVNVALGDGAVRFVSETTDLRVWRAIATIHGAEANDLALSNW